MVMVVLAVEGWNMLNHAETSWDKATSYEAQMITQSTRTLYRQSPCLDDLVEH